MPVRPVPTPLSLQHANASEYTLRDVPGASFDADEDSVPLNTPTTPTYGSTFAQRHPEGPARRPSSRRLVLNATLKMAAVFIVSTVVLGSILWVALPTLDEEDRPKLGIPKSFAQLQDLNGILKKYRDIYPYRIVICFVVTYLFLQAFSLPGSMYMSILGGAVWGVPIALPLVCCCVATGATLCYLISDALGPALLTFPKWKAMLDKWARRIQKHQDNMISFLIVLRIAPLPPHWVLNLLAPHVGITIPVFWITTALGILGVSVIHTTIGGGLDEMTSSDDFHLISWKNFFGLSAVVAGALIPVGLRYFFGKRAGADDDNVDEVIADEESGNADEDADANVSVTSRPTYETPRPGEDAGQRLLDDDELAEEYDDDDEDIILESGASAPLLSSNNRREAGGLSIT